MKDSFGKTIGKTIIIALIFGLVAGGVIAVISLGANKLFGKGREMASEAEYVEKDTEEETEEESVWDLVKDKDKNAAEDDKEEADEETEDSADEEDKEAEEEEVKEEETEDKDEADETETADTEDEIDSVVSNSTAAAVYDVSGIVENAQPSIVSITTTVTTQYQYFFQNVEQDSSAAGSGIIYGQDDSYLYIATNYHVIEDAKEIKVGFNDGEVVDASVKGYEESDDLAIVQVSLSAMQDSTKSSIKVASFGDSDSLKVGEMAIAIGNALGYGQSVTVGYISALDRSIESSDNTYIQTDAAINPGNSGGALLNANGQVIGVNSVKYVDSSVEGMGFSIPINYAKTILDDIVAGVQTATPYLGIKSKDVSSDYAAVYSMPEGIYVKEVISGSPAESGGLKAGDVIVEFDGNEVYTGDDLQSAIRKKSVGDSVNVKVYRQESTDSDYEEVTVTVTLGSNE